MATTRRLIRHLEAWAATRFRLRRRHREGGGALNEYGGGQGQSPFGRVDVSDVVADMACRRKAEKGVRACRISRGAETIQEAKLHVRSGAFLITTDGCERTSQPIS